MKSMKNAIGFRDRNNDDNEKVITAEPVSLQEGEPFCCVAKVRFKDSGCSLDYYNDEFYLESGDKVFVSGRYYGQLGVVESITTHFRIDKNKYKKIIGKPDLRIAGSFIPVNDKMISFDTNFDAEKFEAIMLPPPDPESDESEEIICGEGWSVVLACFEESDDVDFSKVNPALEYCNEGKVVYLSLRNGRGTAFIKGSKPYKAEFGFDGETVSDLFCTCPFNDDCLCKHEVAVLITLRMLCDCPELEGKTDYVAFDSDFFWNYVSAEGKEIRLK